MPIKRALIVAPHPDDEVFGAGGTLLRRKAEGGKLAWVIVTSVSESCGWSAEKISQRAHEIKRVSEFFGFDRVFELNFPTTQLDRVSMGELVAALGGAFQSFEPEEVFVPHASDVHSDHRVVFEVAASCTKWFRYPSVKRVLAYETLSETDFGIGAARGFSPNVFVNIESFLEEKLGAMDIYASELGLFPFPRSHEAVRALAAVRGVASGFKAAEAFELLRDRS